MDRRDFSKLALGTAGLLASGCTLPEEIILELAQACASPLDNNKMFRVDMHCHLLNLDDGNNAAFLNRHYVQAEEPSFFADVIAGGAIRLSDVVASWFVKTIDDEIEFLNRVSSAPFDDKKFCENANRQQNGVFLGSKSGVKAKVGAGRSTGFLSNRLRNAALMMAYWPTVDLFTPSMVDFYEVSVLKIGVGGPRSSEPVHLYEALHRATRGRFVPLVSFHPEREMKQGPKPGQPKQLELVEKAICEMGFIGVKVHPTTGFDPMDNEMFGCPNTWLQLRSDLTQEEKEGYQDAMKGLYELCDRLDTEIGQPEKLDLYFV
jgi:hypothetical protein